MADEPRKPRIRGAQDHRAPAPDPRARSVHGARQNACRWRRGYGKTMLTEQWAPRDGRVVGWFRARAVRGRRRGDGARARRRVRRRRGRRGPPLARAARCHTGPRARGDGPRGDAGRGSRRLARVTAGSSSTTTSTLPRRSRRSRSSRRSSRAHRCRSCRRPGAARRWVAAAEHPRRRRPRDTGERARDERRRRSRRSSTERAPSLRPGSSRSRVAGLRSSVSQAWPRMSTRRRRRPARRRSTSSSPRRSTAASIRGVRTGLELLATMPLVDRELVVTLIGAERAELVVGTALALGTPRRAGRPPRAAPARREFLVRRARAETQVEAARGLPDRMGVLHGPEGAGRGLRPGGAARRPQRHRPAAHRHRWTSS